MIYVFLGVVAACLVFYVWRWDPFFKHSKNVYKRYLVTKALAEEEELEDINEARK